MTEARRAGGGFYQMRLPFAGADLPVLAGIAVLAVPTIVSLGQQTWSTEAGAHGPIVLAVGSWLLVREWGAAKSLAKPGSMLLMLLGLAVSLALYVFGRAFDFISLEVAGLYGAAVSSLYSRIGLQALRRLWFPVVYLGFLVPPPNWLMDRLTAPLKQFVSWAAMSVLSAAGIPVSREGVTIYVGSYRLLVEDACSGMNSIVGLVAVSLLYIYLLRGSQLRYAALLAASTIPIAILGNIIRIMTLILLTYFFGDAVAQGFMHQAAGLFLFAIDLLLVFALDTVMWRVLPKSWKAA
jgi:exosortase